MRHAIEVQGLDHLFFFGCARSAGIVRIKSAGSLPSARARIISMPSPTLASPCSMRTKYVLAMPARAASARCDMPVSARAATTLRARARVSSFGAASASAADGVSGRRFALTPAKNTTASRRQPSVAVPGPTGDVMCLTTAGCYAESATAAPYKYLLYIGLCSGFSVDNPRPYSQVCVNARPACSRFCAPNARRSVNNFANGGPFRGGCPVGGVADSACRRSRPTAPLVRKSR